MALKHYNPTSPGVRGLILARAIGAPADADVLAALLARGETGASGRLTQSRIEATRSRICPASPRQASIEARAAGSGSLGLHCMPGKRLAK